MISTKLEDIAEVFRGYSPKPTFITKDRDIGRPVFLINYSDIDNQKIRNKEYTLLKNVNFDNLHKRYRVEKFDIVLPTTFSSNLEIKFNLGTDIENNKIMSLYSQNVVVIRLKKLATNSYSPLTFWNYLNIKKVQEKLISKSYSNGKTTKAIMIEELRKLKVPLQTEELTLLLAEYLKSKKDLIDAEEKKKQIEERIYELIKNDIMSK